LGFEVGKKRRSGIEPTNRGFAVDRELLRWTLSRSIPLHKANRFSVGLRLIVFR